jgi:hypothetical protein
MAEPISHPPALLLLAAFSRYRDALHWARDRAADTWGPAALESEPFDFTETNYYAATMGTGLRKMFFAFDGPLDPGELADVKLRTNDWEKQYAAEASHPEPRPLNLDPGYLTLAKLVLASTKDHAHRIYLGRGIYAEITLSFRAHRWQAHELTYADYRREDYQRFFSACREHLHCLEREGRAT